MSLAGQLKQDLIIALKSKQALEVQVLRLLLSTLQNEQINQKKTDLPDAEVVKLLKREAKKRAEAVAAFTQGGRPELAAKETAELTVIKKYLPPELSPDLVRQKVKEVIQQSGLAQFGPLMGKVMAALGPQADGQVVQQIVKEELNSK